MPRALKYSPFSILLISCNLSCAQAAAYLGIKGRCAANYYRGESTAPPYVMDKIRGLYRQIQRNAFAVIKRLDALDFPVLKIPILTDEQAIKNYKLPYASCVYAMFSQIIALRDYSITYATYTKPHIPKTYRKRGRPPKRPKPNRIYKLVDRHKIIVGGDTQETE